MRPRWRATPARSIAFEANPEVAAFARSVAARNVEVVNMALSSRAGRTTLDGPAQRQGPRRHRAGQHRAEAIRCRARMPSRVEVETRRLDDFAIANCGFIKIDVEGHEEAVLDGASALIAAQRPVLMVELNEDVQSRRRAAPRGALRGARTIAACFCHRAKLRPVAEFDPARHQNADEPEAPPQAPARRRVHQQRTVRATGESRHMTVHCSIDVQARGKRRCPRPRAAIPLTTEASEACKASGACKMGGMGRITSNIIFLSVLMGFLAAPALAEKRVALVIGNADYVHISRLKSAANDAVLVAETLRSLGFGLVGGGPILNADKQALDLAVQRFGRELQGADVGLFYFAGHGVELNDTNFLIPTGADPVRSADLDFQAVEAKLVLRQMEAAGTRLNLMILDACRNNPFAGRGLRSIGRGLARMESPLGTLISFAAQPGAVADDGSDGHSPYTRALADMVRRPGLDIFEVFNEVGLTVQRKTGGAQRPWLTVSPISGKFYFSEPVQAPSSPIVPADEVLWSSIKEFKSPETFD